jgi:DNA-binding transcriptional LysR family regulator
MTLEELESFVRIATGAGFTHTARQLARSQPAISRRIRRLEQSLDTPLFERVGRGVRLSNAGRAFLPHAEVALAALRDGERAVRESAGRAGGPLSLRVAIVGTLADSNIVDALRELQAAFEGASVEMRTANSREVSDLVRRGEADLGVRYFADPDPKLESIALGSEQVSVVVPAAHRIRAERVRDLRAFDGDTWLGFPADRSNPEASLERRLLAAGVSNPRITPVDSLTAQKRLVEAGLGIAMLPHSSFREELKLGTLRMVDVASLRSEQPVVVVRRRSGRHGQIAEKFIEILERSSAELLSGKRGAPRGAKRRKTSGKTRRRIR